MKCEGPNMPKSSKPGAAYPANWPAIAARVKAMAGERCERCGHPNEEGHVLTVHHLDMDPSNCADWNLAALCQQCHLQIQAKVDWHQQWMFHHNPWLIPHIRGFEAAQVGLTQTRRTGDYGMVQCPWCGHEQLPPPWTTGDPMPTEFGEGDEEASCETCGNCYEYRMNYELSTYVLETRRVMREE